MNILLIGSGGRECALARCLARGAKNNGHNDNALFAAPGNPGIDHYGKCLELSGTQAIIEFSKQNLIDLVVIGPETPLADGLTDRLEAAGIATFGPSKQAARLESSKSFAKQICLSAEVPSAEYSVFSDHQTALKYARSHELPMVIKADGLAAGKGVTVAFDRQEAFDAITHYFNQPAALGDKLLLIERFMSGTEVSFFALCDGKMALPFATAQDYKRAFDGNVGPNTGGMGAFSPSPLVDRKMVHQIMTTIINPIVTAMALRGTPYKGVLYAGLMITEQVPKVVEFNVRFGDPECQAIMARFDGDLAQMLLAAARGDLAGIAVKLRDQFALTVVYASKGYPGNYHRGGLITGLSEAAKFADVIIDHANAKRDNNGLIRGDGGRVLNVTALGNSLTEARDRAYRAIAKIKWEDGFFRKDIGLTDI